MFKKKNPQSSLIANLLQDFGCKTEDQLLIQLDRESQTIPCIICGKEIPLSNVKFISGDPYCNRCK